MNFTVYKYAFTLVNDDEKKSATRHEISIGRLMSNLKREKHKADAVKIRNKKPVQKFFHKPEFMTEAQKDAFYNVCNMNDVKPEEMLAYDYMSRPVKERIKETVRELNRTSILLAPEFLEPIIGLPGNKIFNLLYD